MEHQGRGGVRAARIAQAIIDIQLDVVALSEFRGTAPRSLSENQDLLRARSFD